MTDLLTRAEENALHTWLTTGDRGISSDTIVWHLTGRTHPRYPSVPSDPSDFRRCERLLRAVPSLRAALPQMVDLGSDWARLVDRWDEIVTAIEAEVPGGIDNRFNGNAHRAYALIQECRQVNG